ncbi:MAG: SDR family NAD(P)-dependent oxidoreductase, partial [Marinibacterium sp.]
PVSRERTVDGIVAKFMEVADAVTGGAPAAVPAQAPLPTGPTPEAVTAKLLDLISERTGYPPEMLGRDLNLEADLGIDSIKRVEILAGLRLAFLAEAGEAAHDLMGPVSRERTVDGIVAKFMEVADAVTAGAPEAAATAAPAQAPEPPVADDLPRRFVMQPVPVDIPDPRTWVTKGALYVLTDDRSGVATALASLVTAAGGKTLILDPDGLTPAGISDELAGREADVAGILHCASLLPGATGVGEPGELITGAARATEALFAVLSAVGSSLSERPDAVIVAASAMGGGFGFDGIETMDPGAAGAAGLLKTLSKEWTQAHVRAVDLEPGDTPANKAALIFDEAGRPGEAVEIGWTGTQRFALAAVSQPADLYEDPVPQDVLDENSVVLVTGGARGITALCLKWLAQKYRPHLVIAGSSPAPVDETAETAALQDAGALRAHLAKAAKARGEKLDLAGIELQARSILKAREIRATLDGLRNAGARVEYHQCDVRDGAAVRDLVGQVYDSHGRLDGAINGAGIIEDQLILDKTLNSFRRVMSTKVDSAFHLAAALRPETLKFLVYFTSVAGRFGNRGQGDYGAANEIVSKYARRLDAAWPGRVVAVSWGPWDSDGMVSEEIKAQFSALGIEAVPPAIGIRALEAEILAASDSAPEVVWGYGPWANDMDGAAGDPPVKAAE